MLAKIVSIATVAFLAVATPAMAQVSHKPSFPPSLSMTSLSQCNTGSLECCQSVQNSDSSDIAKLLGLLAVIVEGVNIPIGVGCSPITVSIPFYRLNCLSEC